MKRSWNWPLGVGFIVAVGGLASYEYLVWFPLTRDFPWLNFMLFGIGGDVLAWEHSDALAGETASTINWCFAHGRKPGSNVLSPVTKPSRTSATRT